MKSTRSRPGLRRWKWFVPLTALVLVLVVTGSCQPVSEQVPGVAIVHSPASSEIYIGSPSIAILPDGRYVASHDFFGAGNKGPRTRIYRSDDRGQTWTYLTQVAQTWSVLFVHRDQLYLMGRHPQGVVIRRSEDNGETWTDPVDETTGLLLRGNFHCAPGPVSEHDGRLWHAMESIEDDGEWAEQFRAFMMSAPADADLLQAANWTSSNRLSYNENRWRGMGWLEGNAVPAPDGKMLNILRLARQTGTATVIEVSPDGTWSSFNPKDGYIDFPGGAKKFTIRYDPKSELYWSITNYIQPLDRFKTLQPGWIRNTATLISSPDLKHWTVRRTLLHHPDVYWHGFQYWDWQFDGDDIIGVSRTAYDDGQGGANNYHDANYLTFHRVENFRTDGTSSEKN